VHRQQQRIGVARRVVRRSRPGVAARLAGEPLQLPLLLE